MWAVKKGLCLGKWGMTFPAFEAGRRASCDKGVTKCLFDEWEVIVLWRSLHVPSWGLQVRTGNAGRGVDPAAELVRFRPGPAKIWAIGPTNTPPHTPPTWPSSCCAAGGRALGVFLRGTPNKNPSRQGLINAAGMMQPPMQLWSPLARSIVENQSFHTCPSRPSIAPPCHSARLLCSPCSPPRHLHRTSPY